MSGPQQSHGSKAPGPHGVTSGIRACGVASLARTTSTVLRDAPCRHVFRAVTRLARYYETGSSLFRRTCGILLILPVLALSSACSTPGKAPGYLGSRQQPPLEVPPDLDKPVFNERMKIPDAPVAVGDGTGDDMPPSASEARSIEKPPVLLEEE